MTELARRSLDHPPVGTIYSTCIPRSKLHRFARRVACKSSSDASRSTPTKWHDDRIITSRSGMPAASRALLPQAADHPSVPRLFIPWNVLPPREGRSGLAIEQTRTNLERVAAPTGEFSRVHESAARGHATHASALSGRRSGREKRGKETRRRKKGGKTDGAS